MHETMTAADEFHRSYYDSHVWQDTRWLGVPAYKCPLDLWVYQDVELRHLLRYDGRLDHEQRVAVGGDADPRSHPDELDADAGASPMGSTAAPAWAPPSLRIADTSVRKARGL